MIIETPTKAGNTLGKRVEVGGGIAVPVPGTRYYTNCEVLEIDDAGNRVLGKGIGFTAWFHQSVIKDALSPGDFAVQSAINEQDHKDDELE
jgi:hypothetical protein